MDIKWVKILFVWVSLLSAQLSWKRQSKESYSRTDYAWKGWIFAGLIIKKIKWLRHGLHPYINFHVHYLKPFIHTLKRPFLWAVRQRLSPSVRVWRMPAPHLRPFLDAGQRLVVAWGVFAVHRVSAASYYQLLLQREEALLQTRLPTVRTIRSFYGLVWMMRADDCCCGLEGCCVSGRKKDSKVLFELHQIYSTKRVEVHNQCVVCLFNLIVLQKSKTNERLTGGIWPN